MISKKQFCELYVYRNTAEISELSVMGFKYEKQSYKLPPLAISLMSTLLLEFLMKFSHSCGFLSPITRRISPFTSRIDFIYLIWHIMQIVT